MLVELLGVGEGDGASRASARHVLLRANVSLAASGRLLSAVGWVLLHAVDRSKMSLEDICAVERLFSRGTRAWAEATHHGALVVSKGMAVLVVLPCEALVVVFASGDGALLGPLVLVGKHVCLQILENATALWERAHALFSGLVVEFVAACALAAGARVLRVERGIGLAPLTHERWVWLKALRVEVRRWGVALQVL